MSRPDHSFDESSEVNNLLSTESGFSNLAALSNLDSEAPVQLRYWSAQDFSNIYVRFRPHLEKHARKFLSNPSIAEEVVQDAFLYLMTALPDLDSEVGVLRFLKWKTRLLCLDVIRAQGGNPILNAEHLEDSTAATDQDLSESIERADDAAIVRLALAQLSPRHRQAILATVFEEKSSQQAAEDMGLSENAFRQLLLRARRSFKTVFVGEAEAEDMSVSEALNLAAKRHRLKLISGSALVLALFATLSTAPNTELSDDVVASPAAEPNQQASPAPTPEQQGGSLDTNASSEESSLDGFETSDNQAVASSVLVAPESPEVTEDPTQTGFPTPSAEEEERKRLQVELASAVAKNPLRVGASGTSTLISTADEMLIRHGVFEDVELVVHLGSCEAAAESKPCKIYIEDSRNGNNLIWLAQTFASEPVLVTGSASKTMDVVATDFLVGDFGGTFGNVAVDAPTTGALEYLRFKIEFEGLQLKVVSLELIKSGI
jgi:RNA polymerase sigma factor (sigma-70 family)